MASLRSYLVLLSAYSVVKSGNGVVYSHLCARRKQEETPRTGIMTISHATFQNAETNELSFQQPTSNRRHASLKKPIRPA